MQEEKGKRRWLDDPVVVRKMKVVKVVEEEEERGEPAALRGDKVKEGLEGRREGSRREGGEGRRRDVGWGACVASAWR